MRGYYDDPEGTAATFTRGWFRTGDLGYVDDDGFVFIVDRKKDLIIRGGYNVYPREIEEVLYTHPAVAEAAVIGVPDPRLGEEVKAFVVLAAGAAADRGGAHRVRQGAGGRLQVPAARGVPRRVRAQRHGQDPQEPAALTPSRPRPGPIGLAGSPTRVPPTGGSHGRRAATTARPVRPAAARGRLHRRAGGRAAGLRPRADRRRPAARRLVLAGPGHAAGQHRELRGRRPGADRPGRTAARSTASTRRATSTSPWPPPRARWSPATTAGCACCPRPAEFAPRWSTTGCSGRRCSSSTTRWRPGSSARGWSSTSPTSPRRAEATTRVGKLVRDRAVRRRPAALPALRLHHRRRGRPEHGRAGHPGRLRVDRRQPPGEPAVHAVRGDRHRQEALRRSTCCGPGASGSSPRR